MNCEAWDQRQDVLEKCRHHDLGAIFGHNLMEAFVGAVKHPLRVRGSGLAVLA